MTYSYLHQPKGLVINYHDGIKTRPNKQYEDLHNKR